ncbi:MAG: hypothetical protein IJA43_07915 [Clostridia bacterium]|nr:hypothetical protein [Clostridia bacterium]
MIKKLVSIILASSMLFLCSFSTFAIDDVEQYVFIDENGNEITYYIDDENIPFTLVDGEKIYIALGLPEYEVTDTAVINELNMQRLCENDISSRSVPTDFFDLSDCANNVNSEAYTVRATGLDEAFFSTSVFKYNKHHQALVIKTSSHRPLFCAEEVNIIYHYYSVDSGKWYGYTMMNKDCSVLGGFRLFHSPSVYEYGRVEIRAHSTLASCDVEIYTTPYATGGSSLPNAT